MMKQQKGAGHFPDKFFRDAGLRGGSFPVNGNVLTIASGYGAHSQRKYTITERDTMNMVMAFGVSKTPEEERRAIASALSVMEARIAKALGLEPHPGVRFGLAGDERYCDNVDQTWNTSAILLWLEWRGILRWHHVMEPVTRWSLLRWHHSAAVLSDITSSALWAIDASLRHLDGTPYIITLDQWQR